MVDWLVGYEYVERLSDKRNTDHVIFVALFPVGEESSGHKVWIQQKSEHKCVCVSLCVFVPMYLCM